MPSKQQFIKDPNAVLDYKFDWKALTNGRGTSDWLQSGETILSHTIIATSGITVNTSSQQDTNTSVVVWLSGGTVGQVYDVTCRITSSSNRVDDRSIRISVQQR